MKPLSILLLLFITSCDVFIMIDKYVFPTKYEDLTPEYMSHVIENKPLAMESMTRRYTLDFDEFDNKPFIFKTSKNVWGKLKGINTLHQKYDITTDTTYDYNIISIKYSLYKNNIFTKDLTTDIYYKKNLYIDMTNDLVFDETNDRIISNIILYKING